MTATRTGMKRLPAFNPNSSARARKRAGMTQAELARRAGLSQPAVARLEDPDYNPTLDMLERVAAALGARLEVDLRAA